MMEFGGVRGLELESGLSDLAIKKKRKKYNKVTCTFSDAAFQVLADAATERDVTKSHLMKAVTVDFLRSQK